VVSDESLFEQLVKGDLTAFDQLYARHERPLFAMAYRTLGDQAEAEDVIHEAFLAVLKQRDGGRRSFKAWLFQVARHLCLNRVRSAKRGARALEVEAREGESLAPHPEGQLQGAQLARSLERAVAGLPDTLSELYRLRVAGFSYDELAEILEVPLGTVKSRMHELISRLRQQMERA
jgi:RNA polymerase sigma-70 factor (ECF subfamily)